MAIDTPSKERVILHKHICDLPKSSDSNLPKLPPNAKFYSRWKRNFQKLFLVSARHPLTRLILHSRASVAFEKRRHAKSPHRWMLHPCSMLRFYWDMMMTVILLYIFVTVPLIICFYRIGNSAGPEYWNIIYPVYGICFIDIFLNFITGYVSSDGHEIFLNIGVVTRHYLKGYFFVDFISSIPYAWFFPTRILPPGPDSNSALLIIEFLPILKIIRISTVQYRIQQINAIFRTSHAKETKIWLFILTLLIFHWSSCISYIFPYIVMHIQGKSMKNSAFRDAYYIPPNFHDISDWKVYLVFLHIGVSNLMGSNFKEFENFEILDVIIRCILLLLGKGYMIYLIVTILQLLELSAEPELKHQQIIRQVKKYIHQEKLPRYLRNKLISYYEYRYQGLTFKESIISDNLSNHLNQEILFHSNQGLLDIVILRNLPRKVVGDLIILTINQLIVDSLKSVMYLEGDIIYEAGTISDCMYFIGSGSVALITFSGKEICHLHDGDYFGEAGLIYPDQRRTESVITLEMCELLRLHHRDFKHLFAINSKFYENLQHVAQERLQRIKELDIQNANKMT